MAYGQKSIIGSSEFIRNLYGNIIFNENPYENALEYLVFGEDFYGDRLTGSNFWSSEDRVRARFHYAESRQK